MSYLPTKKTLTIWKDSTFRQVVKVYLDVAQTEPWTLTDFSGSCNIYSSSRSLLMKLNTSEGGMSIEDNEIELEISAIQTSEIEWTGGIYELLVTEPEGDTYALLWGSIKVEGI